MCNHDQYQEIKQLLQKQASCFVQFIYLPSSPASSPVVECVESKRLGAGRAHKPRACALGRPGLRTGGGGEPGVGREGGVGVWSGLFAWGRVRPGRVGVRGCGSHEMVLPVTLGMRACHCPLSTLCSQLRAPPPQPPWDTCPLTPYPRPSRGARASSQGPQGVLAGRPALGGKERFQRRAKGASLGGGRDWRRQERECMPKSEPLLHWGTLGSPTGRVANFSPT